MKLIRLLGVSALLSAAPLGAALSVQSAFLPGAEVAVYSDIAGANSAPVAADLKKLQEALKEQLKAAAPAGGSSKLLDEALAQELGLTEKDFLSVAGSVKGINSAMEGGVPDVAFALQLDKKVDGAKLIEVLKKHLAKDAPEVTITETTVGVRKVYSVKSTKEGAEIPEFQVYITGDAPKTLVFAGTPNGLKAALANEKGALTEGLQTPLTPHGKPQMWVSFALPESLKAQVAAMTAGNPFGPGSNHLGTLNSLALSGSLAEDLKIKFSGNFSRPEGANVAKAQLEFMAIPMIKQQLADPKTKAAPAWTNGLTVATSGNSVILTMALSGKDMEALMNTAMQQAAGGAGGPGGEAPAPAPKEPKAE